MMHNKNLLLDFQRNLLPNTEGLYLKDIWEFSDFQLEYKHNYIQWMFPTKTPSKFQPDVPVLTDIDAKEITECYHYGFRKSLVRMLAFYGYVIEGGSWYTASIKINPKTFVYHQRNWLTEGNHNFLRLTRIMESCMLTGHTHLANQLFNQLEIVSYFSKEVSPETFEFWKRAVDR